jgi:L-alanine-DL-glutamate epimerase-like enolase superfamily enzyme
MALSALDVALWDLKAKLLGVSVASLLGPAHEAVPVYGSGGFCSYSLDELREQLGGWVAEGIPRVKMKVGRDPERDPARLDAAREAVGEAQLYVDANGALTRKQALDWAHRFRDEWNVTWFEEPVSSDDLDGLRLVRDHGPGGLEVAAGEYGFMLPDFARLAAAVDCLQADVTRCGGITALQQVDGVSAAAGIDLSAHCAPAVSASAFGAVQRLRHLEYFHDHVRVEGLLLAGVPEPRGGLLEPDRSRPGHGLELKRADAERYEA